MTNVAVVLSGCGVYDGSEIHESVITLLCLDQLGATYQCFAPNADQTRVVNHVTGEVAEGETRNVMVEAARIARGNIQDVAFAKVGDFDAVILPGGFGAATNLCDFAIEGANCDVQTDVGHFLKSMHAAKKPIGLICIAPVLAPKLFDGATCTIGNDKDTAAAIEKMGGKHKNCAVDEIVIDMPNKLVTTPAYMLAKNLTELSTGISKLVDKIVELTK